MRVFMALRLLLAVFSLVGTIACNRSERVTPSSPRGVKTTTVTLDRKDIVLYQKRYAVVVGINTYPKASQKFGQLLGAVPDARFVADRLRALGFDEIITLFDDAATKSAMTYALGDDIGGRAGQNDLILFYFAGHGDTRGDGNQPVGYIIPYDYDPTRHMSTSISMSTLQDISKEIKARHVLYVMDSCFSGNIFNQRAPSQRYGKLNREFVQSLLEKPAHIVITAGAMNESSTEENGRGLFTSVFLAGLSGKADEKQTGIITAQRLALYIQETLPSLLPPGVRQTPQYGRLLGEGDVILTLNNNVLEQSPDPAFDEDSQILRQRLNEMEKQLKQLQEGARVAPPQAAQTPMQKRPSSVGKERIVTPGF